MISKNNRVFHSLAIALTISASLGISSLSHAATTVIKADALVDVNNSKVLDSPLVIIENNVIQYVGTQGLKAVPNDATV